MTIRHIAIGFLSVVAGGAILWLSIMYSGLNESGEGQITARHGGTESRVGGGAPPATKGINDIGNQKEASVALSPFEKETANEEWEREQEDSDVLHVMWDTFRRTKNINLSDRIVVRLHQGDDGKWIYNDIRGAFRAGSALSSDEQAYMLSFLGEVASLEAAETLVDIIADGYDYQQDDELRLYFYKAIGAMNGFNYDSQYHAENSEPLERLWKIETTQADPQMQATVARTIATIGTPAGIKLLLDELRHSDERTDLIEYALAELRNREVIGQLAIALNESQPGEPLFNASGGALASMGESDATYELLKFASNAPDESERKIVQWLDTAMSRNPESIKRIQSELAKLRFRSDKIRNVIALRYAEYEQYISR